MEPYLIFEDDMFLVFFKPPYYIMDTDSIHKYKDKCKKDYECMFKQKVKPFHVWVKLYLNKHFKINANSPDYNCCQRLDINTSGMVLVSKHNQDFKLCRSIINDKINTTKVYICLVNGLIQNKSGFIINNIKCFKKPTYCKTIPYDKKNYKSMPSCSYYYVKNEYLYKDKYYSLVYVRIFTGRTHQVRVHMKSLGTPIVSDDKYTPYDIRKDNYELIERIFLHNHILQFKYIEKNYKFKLPLTDDLKKCIKKLKLFKKYPTIKELMKTKCASVL